MTEQQDSQQPTAPEPAAVQESAAPAKQVLIAKYDDYASAQEVVDMLSDKGFDVSTVDILGRGLHSVESVQGRMSNGKAALYGALSGLWFGLFIGILFAMFMPLAWLRTLIIAVALGALWGALFGFLSHALTGGKRDFASVKTLKATHYELLIDAPKAEEAKRLIAEGR